jgi:hypothetical protein
MTRLVAVAVLTLGLAACSLDVPLPPGLVDPNALSGAAGAKAIRDGPIVTLNGTIPSVAFLSGILTDELRDTNGQYASIDSRSGFTVGLNVQYTRLQLVRYQLLDAIGTLQKRPASSYPKAWLVELYALTAYVEAILGEQICSGTPLSTVNDDGTPNYGDPLTTDQVFLDALAKTETALTFSGDSARLDNLARVVRGRILLDLGRAVEGASAVASVPTDYVYEATFNSSNPNAMGGLGSGTPAFAVADTEGRVGLPFASAKDRRVPWVARGSSSVGPITVYALRKYQTPLTPLPIANGVEARLIEAEASLPGADGVGSWLATVNALRATIGLADTTDPGTSRARLDLVFRERAFWLFATGHRLGDLRRLVSRYARSPDETFPNGPYFQSANGTYGMYGDVRSFPIAPGAESANPKFHGCLEE